MAGLVVVVAFVPQLLETYRRKGRGSISYLFFTIQSVGCFLVSATNAFAFHDKWETWAPFLVGGTIQAAIVGLGGYFLCLRPQRRSEPYPVEVGAAEAVWPIDAAASLLPQSAPLNSCGSSSRSATVVEAPTADKARRS